MSWRVMEDEVSYGTVACFWCDTSDTAFGPVFYGATKQDLEDFAVDFLSEDPRQYDVAELEELFSVYRQGCEQCGRKYDKEAEYTNQ